MKNWPVESLPLRSRIKVSSGFKFVAVIKSVFFLI